MAEEPIFNFDTEKDIVLAFTTPVVYLKAEQTDTLNKTLRDLILAKETSSKGVSKSNAGGWQSETNLAQWDDPAIAALFKLIDPVVRRISGLVVGQQPWPGGMSYVAWANVNRTHQYNKTHNHPGFHWSGVYYVSASEDDSDDKESGKIEFQDPRGFASMVPMLSALKALVVGSRSSSKSGAF